MNKVDLLPCAHCGGDAQTDFIEGVSYIIECHDCDARCGAHDSPEAAIEAWNRRIGSFFAAGVKYGLRMSLEQIYPPNVDLENIPMFPRREYFFNTGLRQSVQALEVLNRAVLAGHIDIGE